MEIYSGFLFVALLAIVAAGIMVCNRLNKVELRLAQAETYIVSAQVAEANAVANLSAITAKIASLDMSVSDQALTISDAIESVSAPKPSAVAKVWRKLRYGR